MKYSTSLQILNFKTAIIFQLISMPAALKYLISYLMNLKQQNLGFHKVNMLVGAPLKFKQVCRIAHAINTIFKIGCALSWHRSM